MVWTNVMLFLFFLFYFIYFSPSPLSTIHLFPGSIILIPSCLCLVCSDWLSFVCLIDCVVIFSFRSFILLFLHGPCFAFVLPFVLFRFVLQSLFPCCCRCCRDGHVCCLPVWRWTKTCGQWWCLLYELTNERNAWPYKLAIFGDKMLNLETRTTCIFFDNIVTRCMYTLSGGLQCIKTWYHYHRAHITCRISGCDPFRSLFACHPLSSPHTGWLSRWFGLTFRPMSQFVHIQYSHFHILSPPIFPTMTIIHLNLPTISLRPPSNTPPVDAPLAVHLLPSPNDTCVMCFPHVRRNDRPVRGTRCVPRKPHTHTHTHTHIRTHIVICATTAAAGIIPHCHHPTLHLHVGPPGFRIPATWRIISSSVSNHYTSPMPAINLMWVLSVRFNFRT